MDGSSTNLQQVIVVDDNMLHKGPAHPEGFHRTPGQSEWSSSAHRQRVTTELAKINVGSHVGVFSIYKLCAQPFSVVTCTPCVFLTIPKVNFIRRLSHAEISAFWKEANMQFKVWMRRAGAALERAGALEGGGGAHASRSARRHLGLQSEGQSQGHSQGRQRNGSGQASGGGGGGGPGGQGNGQGGASPRKRLITAIPKSTRELLEGLTGIPNVAVPPAPLDRDGSPTSHRNQIFASLTFEELTEEKRRKEEEAKRQERSKRLKEQRKREARAKMLEELTERADELKSKRWKVVPNTGTLPRHPSNLAPMPFVAVALGSSVAVNALITNPAAAEKILAPLNDPKPFEVVDQYPTREGPAYGLVVPVKKTRIALRSSGTKEIRMPPINNAKRVLVNVAGLLSHPTNL